MPSRCGSHCFPNLLLLRLTLLPSTPSPAPPPPGPPLLIPDLSVLPQLSSLHTQCSLGESLQDHGFQYDLCADATHPRPSSNPCTQQPTWHSKASQRHMRPTELRAVTSRGTCFSPTFVFPISGSGSCLLMAQSRNPGGRLNFPSSLTLLSNLAAIPAAVTASPYFRDLTTSILVQATILHQLH